MYKLFVLPLLLCIGGLFIAATNTDHKNTKENPPSEYNLSCMEVELQTQAVRCFGFCDGVLDVVVTGGQEPYTYQWSNGLTFNFSATLPAGEFSVTVTDAAGCEVVATANVGSPSEIEPNLQIEGSCDPNMPIVASVNPTGGVGNYSIEWSTGETSRSIVGLEVGQTYSVTITTGGNGCSVAEEFTVTEGLATSIEKIDISCGNENTGSATATAISGQAPYTFEWSNGVSESSNGSSTIENLAAGSYSVTITDAEGCETEENIEIEDNGDLELEMGSAPSTCKGDEDGMANVIPFGGTAPYIFQWSDGQTTGSAINLAAGTYSVTVADILGCEAVGTVTVESTSNLEITATTNTSNGSVTVMAMGGVEPYTYLWANGETTITSSGYEAGDEYSVTVTDALDCQETITNKFPPRSGELMIDLVLTAPTCPMFTNGILEANASGGTTPYTYEWSTGQTTPSISGLEEGTYGVTVTDADGATATANTTLSSPEPISININPTSGDLCDGTSTDYEAQVTGGTAPYTYQWSNGNTTSSLSSVEAGDYFLTVTDANGCEKIGFLKVNPPFGVKVIGQAVRCADFCDGSVRAMVTGGTAPFSYVWSNGQTGQILEALPVGFYTVTVTDGNGCEGVATGEVTAPPAIEANLIVDGTCESGSNITASINPIGGVGNLTILWSTGETGTSVANLERGQEYTVKITDENGCSITERFAIPLSANLVLQGEKTDIACGSREGGTATVRVLSGTAPYTYDWIGFPDVTTEERSNTLTDLSQGTYRVTVTDANECRGVQTIIIEKKRTLILETGSTPTTCEVASNGMANVIPTGGIEPYTYEWSDGQTTGTAIDVAAGDYTVTVTDAADCQGVATVTVEVGNGFNVEADVDEINSTITVNASGGTAPYTYEWDNGETTQTAVNYRAGDTYSVTVTDANGCTETVTGEFPEPEFGIRITSNPPSCHNFNDGSITANVLAGAPPYTYAWSTGASTPTITGLAAGTYSVTVTDAEGETASETVELINPDPITVSIEPLSGDVCDGTNTEYEANVTGGTMPYTYQWSDGSTNRILSTDVAGDYFLTVTDANGCEEVEFLKVSEPLEVEVIGQAVRCDEFCDGSVRAKVTGGTGPFTYVWSNGQTGQILENLPVGSYTVTVTDANGCEVVATGEVTAPPAIETNLRITGSCDENAIIGASVNPTGGVGDYSIRWSTGSTEASIDNLERGLTYKVTVTDGNGCNVVEEFTIPTEPALVINSDKTDIACENTTGGSASVTILSGEAPYTYVWSDGTTETKEENSSSLNDLEAGTYTVTVTDVNGCTGTVSVTVEQKDGLVLETGSSSTTCEDSADGMANVVPSGGTEPYLYNWSNGQTFATAVNLAAGDYTVTVVDANGCEGIATVTVAPGSGIEVEVSVDETNNAITVTPSGGTAPYTFAWDNGETGATASDYEPCDSYTVIVTDANGCTKTITGEVPGLVATVQTTPTCEGESNGTATLTIQGCTPPYTIDWGTGTDETTETTNTGLTTGTYIATVTDANGNTIEVEYTIDEIIIDLEVTSTPESCGTTDKGSATVSITGGDAPYSITWSNGDATATITDLDAGEYSVTVTDANGCEKVTTVTVEQISTVEVAISTDMETGTITATPSGGTGPYTFLWSNGERGATAMNYEPCDSFSVKVTDADGCMKTITGEVPGLTADIQTTPTCEGESNGSATLNVQGCAAPYTINWGTRTDEVNETTETINNGLTTGIYIVTITDAEGRTREIEYTIGEIIINLEVNSTPAGCGTTQKGSATVSITGGDAPYTIIWSTGDATATVNDLDAGEYIVTVTDDNGCEKVTTVTVGEDSGIEVEVMVNETNNTITVTPSGGTGPYTFEWNNGETGATATNYESCDSFSVKVTDANGCMATITGETPGLIAEVQTTPTCEGESDGTATLNVQGCAAPYTINWGTRTDEVDENSQTTNTGLAGGTYTVTITDGEGRTREVEYTIGEIIINVEISSTPEACGTTEKGSATVNITGGNAPYSILWSTDETTATITDLDAGEYRVTVTDDNGCEKVETVIIGEESDIEVAIMVNETDNAITATPSGGTGPYTFEWDNGETGSTATNYEPCDTYSVKVTDANGCMETITGEVPGLVAEIETTPTCEGESTGIATLTAQGCAAPYTIDWGTRTDEVDETTETSNTGLQGGTYTVTITDADGRTREVEYTIGEIIIDVEVTSTPESCSTTDKGTATVNIDGGNAPYSILWSTNETTVTITDLDAGEYSVTVTDDNGCEKVETVTVGEDSGIEVEVMVDETDNSITVTPSSGTGPYTFEWDNGETSETAINYEACDEYSVKVTDANGCVETVTGEVPGLVAEVETTPTCEGESNGTATLTAQGCAAPYTIDWGTRTDEVDETTETTNTGLPGGTYTVTITDAEGRTREVEYTIGEIIIDVEVTSTPESCGTTDKGTATVNIDGGTAPYNIIWSTGGTTETITNLGAGEYIVTVTDANGCEKVETVTVEEDSSIDVTVNVNEDDNSVTAVPSGGTGPYTFIWDNGETTETATNYEPCSNYSVTVTDNNGCEEITMGETGGLAVEVETTPTCEGEMDGSASLTVKGCTPPYTIDWGNGTSEMTNTGLTEGTYTVTVTDTNGNSREIEYTISETIIELEVSVTPKQCGSQAGGGATVEISGGNDPYTIRWSNGETEIKIDDLDLGEYTVTVTDANGCSKEATITVEEESGIEASITSTPTRCSQSTGTATIVTNTGRPPFTYNWSNSATGDRISGLSAGEIIVTVTDANGCDTVLTTVIEEDNNIVITNEKVDADCQTAANGSITIAIEGGEEPYDIVWSTGATGLEVENLLPGDYIVTVTDNEGCERVETITVGENSDLAIDIGVSVEGMNNGDIGTLTATATGGSGNPDNYTYEWCTGETTATISDLITGAYTVTVTDEGGCTQTSTGFINTPPALEIEPNCDGTANVRAIVGGCVDLEINWDNGATGEEVVIENGDRTVTVTLPNGEEITTSFEIDAPLLEATIITQVNATCEDSTDGSATVSATGGTAPYTYKWSNEAEGESIENLAPGTYTVTVTDADDCETIQTVTIEAEQAIDVSEKVVMVQRDNGNRYERKHARLKYTINDRSAKWFREEL
ncbi:MAG: hypothetical protein AAF599_00175, partial [Bacteroidota bacterium]